MEDIESLTSLESIQSISRNVNLDFGSAKLEMDIGKTRELIKDVRLVTNFPDHLQKKATKSLEALNQMREARKQLAELITSLDIWRIKKKLEFEEIKSNLDVIIYLKYQEENFKKFFLIIDNLLPQKSCGIPKSQLFFIKPDGEKELVKFDQLLRAFIILKDHYGKAQDQLKLIRKVHADAEQAIQLMDANIIGLYKWAVRRKDIPIFEDLEGLVYPKRFRVDARTVSSKTQFILFIVPISISFLIIVSVAFLYIMNPF